MGARQEDQVGNVDKRGNMTETYKYVEQLKKLSESDDPEKAHFEADHILLDLLTDLGYYEVVKAWVDIKKWYA